MIAPRPGSALPDPALRPEFYAGVAFKRLIAWVIDTAAILLLTLIVLPFTAFLALFALPALYVALNLAYRTVGMARWSATPGMWLMAVEFRRHDGDRLDPVTAFLHSLGYTLSVALVVPQIASVALMLITPHGQGLSDHVLGTVAMNRPHRG